MAKIKTYFYRAKLTNGAVEGSMEATSKKAVREKLAEMYEVDHKRRQGAKHSQKLSDVEISEVV